MYVTDVDTRDMSYRCVCHGAVCYVCVLPLLCYSCYFIAVMLQVWYNSHITDPYICVIALLCMLQNGYSCYRWDGITMTLQNSCLCYRWAADCLLNVMRKLQFIHVTGNITWSCLMKLTAVNHLYIMIGMSRQPCHTDKSTFFQGERLTIEVLRQLTPGNSHLVPVRRLRTSRL